MSRVLEVTQDLDTIIRTAKVAALFGTGYLFARRKTRPMAVRIAARTGYALIRSSIKVSYEVARIWSNEISRYRAAKPPTAKPPTVKPPVQMVKDPVTGRWRPPPGGGTVLAFMLFGGIILNAIVTATEEWLLPGEEEEMLLAH